MSVVWPFWEQHVRRLRFQLLDTQEIKRWIMSFGQSATVLEPVELAEEICNDLTRLLEAHQ